MAKANMFYAQSGGVTPVKNVAKMSPDETSFNRQDLPTELRKSA